jgi:hypothetical protein
MDDQQEQEQEAVPEVTCSGGYTLPRMSAFMPAVLGDLLARKEDDHG